jgi:hypothetical protein
MELLKLIGVFLIINTLVYLLGSFIAFELNPMQWWLFKDTLGRILFIILEIILFGMSLKVNE